MLTFQLYVRFKLVVVKNVDIRLLQRTRMRLQDELHQCLRTLDVNLKVGNIVGPHMTGNEAVQRLQEVVKLRLSTGNYF